MWSLASFAKRHGTRIRLQVNQESRCVNRQLLADRIAALSGRDTFGLSTGEQTVISNGGRGSPVELASSGNYALRPANTKAEPNLRIYTVSEVAKTELRMFVLKFRSWLAQRIQ